jgi:hypothetical protein
MKLLKQREICEQASPSLNGADASSTRLVSV